MENTKQDNKLSLEEEGSKELEMQKMNYLDSMEYANESIFKQNEENNGIMELIGKITENLQRIEKFIGMDQQEDMTSPATPMSPDSRKENIQGEMLNNMAKTMRIGGGEVDGLQQ